jgi:hypothetical protein
LRRKQLAFLGGAAALGLAAFLVTRTTHAADHLDSPTLVANPLADINDVYVWMEADTMKVNLAMTVSPGDPGGMTRAFSPAVQYVFHVHSKPMLGVGQMTTKETQIICVFANNMSVQCWVKDNTGTLDYATGNPNNDAGLSSQLGKFKVYAARRTDPFFFNLQGFRNAVDQVKTAAAGGLTLDAAGCPTSLANASVAAVRGLLSTASPTATAPCQPNVADCFAALRVKVILVQIDKTLLNAPNTTNTVIGVWASTHMGS